jgi:ABC-type nitrate/sulfonate/bicarbonate transport system permease component
MEHETSSLAMRSRVESVAMRDRGSWTHSLRRGEFVLALAAIVAVWQMVSVSVNNKTLVPPPLLVLDAWIGLWAAELPGDILASLVHLGVGYGLGIAAGLALALLAARFLLFEAIIDPMVEILRPISAIAWIPIAILMFGIGRGVPIFLIFYAAIFPVFINTLAGIKQVDPHLLQAAQMLGASRRLIVTHVVMPAALPLILAGARLSLGVAWMAMVAGELTGADSGLGWRIFWYQEFFAMDKVMAVILTIGILGYILDTLLRWLQARITRWSQDGSEAGR